MVLATSTNIYCEQHGIHDVPIERCIHICADAGYKALDFGFVEFIRQSRSILSPGWKDEILYYRQLADSLNISFVQAHAPLYDFCNPSDDAERLELLMNRSIEGAALLGAPWIVAHPSTHAESGIFYSDTAAMNVRFFHNLADYARKFSVGIAIENMWGKTADGVERYAIDAQELVDLVDAVDSPNVSACWDTGHASVEGIAQGEAIRLLGNRLKALHISDKSKSQQIHILPYMGSIDWPEILQALADIEYSHPFTLEIQHYIPRVPVALVPSAIKLSVETGKYMIGQIASCG